MALPMAEMAAKTMGSTLFISSLEEPNGVHFSFGATTRGPTAAHAG